MSGRRCFICGEDNPNVLQEHHSVPSRFGGRDSRENLYTLCANCHQAIERIYNSSFYRRLAAGVGIDPSTFDGGAVCEETLSENERFVRENPARAFVDQCLTFERHARTPKSDVYAAFYEFLEHHSLSTDRWDFDRRAVLTQFGSVVNGRIDGEVVNIDIDGGKGYRNVSFTTFGYEMLDREVDARSGSVTNTPVGKTGE